METMPVLSDPTNPDPLKRGLINASATAKWKWYQNLMATELFIIENLMATFQDDNESILLKSYVYTSKWWQQIMLRFQYSASTPQVIEVNSDFELAYPVINDTLKIITRCAVVYSAGFQKVVTLKLAKGPDDALEKLTAPELTAASDYVNVIQPPGLTIICFTDDPDRIYIDAEIFYSGQYVLTVVQAAVEAAVVQYLKDTSSFITFGGRVIITGNENERGIIDYIQAVPGVRDVVLSEIKGRDNGTVWADGTTFTRQYTMSAGYAIPEDTATYTLADSLTYTLYNPL